MPSLTRPRRTALLLASVLLALAGTAGTAAAAAPADDAAWAIRTASNGFGEDRQNYRYTLDPGGTVTDGLVVANHGTKPLTLAVYAADGFTTEDGQLDLLTTDQESTGVGAWLSAARGEVTIAPDKSVEVPFTVTVPDDATPGDYLGGIITSLTQPGAVEGINVDRRLALKVGLRVGGELRPQLAVEDLQVTHDGTLNPVGSGSATVSYTVRNTGNAILSAEQSVSVAGPFGLLEADGDAVEATPDLLPGETWEVTVPVDGVRSSGRLSAEVALTPMLTDASGSTAPLEVVSATGHAWAVPWVLLALVIALVALVAVAVVRRRDRRDREDERVRAAVEEALASQPASR